jgi:hypothetical protein
MRTREYEVPPFEPHELVRYLADAMRPAGQNPGQLGGFRIADRLFVDERKVPADRGFLQNPCQQEDVDKIIDYPHGTVDHYLEIQLSTTGELVTTAFARVTIRGRSLSLDFAACALTRTPDKYHVLDRYREVGSGAVMRSALRGIYAIPRSVGGLWRLIKVPWVLMRAAWARKDRTLIPRRGVMIGTRLSIREEIAVSWEDSRRDYSAIYDDVVIIEQRLLKATEDFLESRNVDTSVLKKLALNIITHGILNMGKIEMTKSAVGENPMININNDDASDDGDRS